MKLEALRRAFGPAMFQFLQLEDVNLINKNETIDNEKGLVYRWFKKTVVFYGDYI